MSPWLLPWGMVRALRGCPFWENTTPSCWPPPCLPLQLLLVLLLPGLGLHLLYLNGVGLPAAHVQLVIPHAELQDPLVNSKAGGIEHEVLQNRTGWTIRRRNSFLWLSSSKPTSQSSRQTSPKERIKKKKKNKRNRVWGQKETSRRSHGLQVTSQKVPAAMGFGFPGTEQLHVFVGVHAHGHRNLLWLDCKASPGQEVLRP